MTFIDVVKAFDSESHDTMILAAQRVGIRGGLLAYINLLYSGTETQTHLKVDIPSVMGEAFVRATPCHHSSSIT